MLSKFKEDPLYNENLKYWYEKWEFIANEVEKGTIGIEIINIRMVLIDIINEYELNKFESDNNRKVYLKLIEKFIKEQHMQLYKDELIILKDYLEKKNGQAAYVLSKELSEIFSKESFAQILFDELLIVIKQNSFSKKHRAKINNLTKDIIIDLVTFGRDIEDVKKLCDNIFTTYQIFEDGRIISSFPYIPAGLSDSEIKEYIDNLSLEDRLDIFKKNLILEEIEYMFIFPVWGIQLNLGNTREKIFGFSLYDPLICSELEKEDWADELFPIPNRSGLEEDRPYESRCNIIINTKAISRNIAKQQAIDKYLFFLNLANLKFGSKYQEIFWDGQYLGKEKNDESSGFGIIFASDRDEKVTRRNLSLHGPIRFGIDKYKKIDNYSNIIDSLQKQRMFVEVNSIINVIELMSKSIWETDENKILNYWICLESLANISKKDKEPKFNFIKETVSNMYFLWEKYRPVHNLFYLTRHYTINVFKRDETINIPEEFITNVKISESYHAENGVSLINFNNRKHELLNYTTKVSFLDEIEDTIEFYEDNKKSLQKLKSKREEVKLTIDYIYKTRNQIVHNGYVAKKLIPYLVNFAESYANAFLQRIIDVYSDGEFNLQEYFIKEQYEANLLEKKLSGIEFYEIKLEE